MGVQRGRRYRDCEHAVSYAEMVSRESDCPEIHTYKADATLADRRVVE
jgi:hypothetical protein